MNVMKCDVDVRLNFYANVVLSSSTIEFQEIGECMTKATDSVGSIHDVSSSASLSSVFCGPDVFLLFFATVGLRHLSNISPCLHVSCPKTLSKGSS